MADSRNTEAPLEVSDPTGPSSQRSYGLSGHAHSDLALTRSPRPRNSLVRTPLRGSRIAQKRAPMTISRKSPTEPRILVNISSSLERRGRVGMSRNTRSPAGAHVKADFRVNPVRPQAFRSKRLALMFESRPRRPTKAVRPNHLGRAFDRRLSVHRNGSTTLRPPVPSRNRTTASAHTSRCGASSGAINERVHQPQMGDVLVSALCADLKRCRGRVRGRGTPSRG